MAMDEERVARGLGWFSIGLGLAEVVAPDSLARVIGVSNDNSTRAVVRVTGVREIAHGAGLLTQPRRAGWLWSRVGGDAIDLTLLGVALTGHAARRERVVAATASVIGVTILDLWCGIRYTRRPDAMPGRMQGLLSRRNAGTRAEDQTMDVKQAITVNRPAHELYQFWHNFENLPRFMDHLESVEVTGEQRSHWKAKAPVGTTAEWDAEVIEDRPNAAIAWRALPGSAVDNAGTVRFTPAPGDRGTEVRVELQYNPPGGALGAVVAKLFGEEPGQQVRDDLRRFKQVMETGEVTQSDASAKGGGSARPPA